MLGLCCCSQAFSSYGEWGLLFILVHGFLIAVASLVVEHGLLGVWDSVVAACGLSTCGSRALDHVGFSSCGSQALEHRLGSRDARA